MLEHKRPLWLSFFATLVIGLILYSLISSFYHLDYSWDFSILKNYIAYQAPDGLHPGLFLTGLWITIKMSLLGILCGTAIGIFVGFLLTSSEIVSKISALLYVDIFRNTPVLVQLYVAYFIVGTAFDLSSMTAGILTLSLFCSAYVAEIVRGALVNLDKGQIDAAKSLGLNQFQIYKLIIAPQAIRVMSPALIGQFVSLVKDSSLLSIVAIPELTKEAQNAVTTTFRSFEVWFFIALMYLVVNTLISSFGKIIEKKLSAHL